MTRANNIFHLNLCTTAFPQLRRALCTLYNVHAMCHRSTLHKLTVFAASHRNGTPTLWPSVTLTCVSLSVRPTCCVTAAVLSPTSFTSTLATSARRRNDSTTQQTTSVGRSPFSWSADGRAQYPTTPWPASCLAGV